MLAATQGLGPEEAFGQLRRRARASSRKLAELAQEVVQDAQRERLAALAADDVRVRKAEARARPPSGPSRPPRPTWPNAGRRTTRPRSLPRSATALLPGATLPLMSATVALMSATMPPTSASGSLTSANWPPMTVI